MKIMKFYSCPGDKEQYTEEELLSLKVKQIIINITKYHSICNLKNHVINREFPRHKSGGITGFTMSYFGGQCLLQFE